jgi:hypothetical protein
MDFDKGIATIRNPEFVKQFGVRNVEYEQFSERDTTKGGVVKNHNAFDDACKYFDKMMLTPDAFDTWIIDSGTTLSESALNKAVVLLGTSAFHSLSKTHAQAMSSGLMVPKIQDYGSERSLVEQFVQMVLDSGKNVVFICHEKEQYEADVVAGYVPLLTGKGVEAICLKFDEVWNLKITGAGQTRKRQLITESDGMRIAKSRYGVPSGIPFTWDAINAELEKIRSAQLQGAGA